MLCHPRPPTTMLTGHCIADQERDGGPVPRRLALFRGPQVRLLCYTRVDEVHLLLRRAAGRVPVLFIVTLCTEPFHFLPCSEIACRVCAARRYRRGSVVRAWYQRGARRGRQGAHLMTQSGLQREATACCGEQIVGARAGRYCATRAQRRLGLEPRCVFGGTPSPLDSCPRGCVKRTLIISAAHHCLGHTGPSHVASTPTSTTTTHTTTTLPRHFLPDGRRRNDDPRD